MAAGSTFTATIGRVNGSGFQIQERPGTWLNCSKYATPPPAIPEPGTVVRITLDGSGFVRGVEPLEDQQPALPLPDRGQAMSRSIIRQVAIKAAARLYAGQGTPVSQVLEAAAAFATWVEED